MYMPDNKMQELLKKYLEGRATPEEEQLVDDWYDSLSSRQDKIHLSDEERRILRSDYWDSIKTKIRGPVGKSRNLWPGLIGVAASIAAIVVMAVLLLPAEIRDQEVVEANVPTRMEEIFNRTEEVSHLALSDGSRVMLFPGSRLLYSQEFNVEERTVHLSGEAFFDISHDAEKPFYVFANEVVTKVLGTSFSVTAYPEDLRITVAVKSGKVSVYTNPEKSTASPEEKIVLTPNQQAVYTRSDQKVSRMLVKEPQVVIPDEEVKKIRFESVPVSEIFKALEKMYNVKIDFEERVFSKCSITTSVTGKDLYERIDVICEITGASYTVEDTTVVISGTGCN